MWGGKKLYFYKKTKFKYYMIQSWHLSQIIQSWEKSCAYMKRVWILWGENIGMSW